MIKRLAVVFPRPLAAPLKRSLNKAFPPRPAALELPSKQSNYYDFNSGFPPRIELAKGTRGHLTVTHGVCSGLWTVPGLQRSVRSPRGSWVPATLVFSRICAAAERPPPWASPTFGLN